MCDGDWNKHALFGFPHFASLVNRMRSQNDREQMVIANSGVSLDVLSSGVMVQSKSS